MAAPTPTPRQTPTGWKMPDGFKSYITFAKQPAINLWEREIEPPGFDANGSIDTTTMFNTRWRTKAAKHLITMDDASGQFAYDPDVLTNVAALIGDEQVTTYTWPDHTTMACYGFLDKWKPAGLREGEFPLAAGTIVVINADPTSNYAEQGPVITQAAGT